MTDEKITEEEVETAKENCKLLIDCFALNKISAADALLALSSCFAVTAGTILNESEIDEMLRCLKEMFIEHKKNIPSILEKYKKRKK